MEKGCAVAGICFFGDGTHEGWAAATDKNQLRPNHKLIKENITVLSDGEQKLLAAMYSFFNSKDGGKLLQSVGVDGLADLSCDLDFEALDLISAMLVNYAGW